MASPEITTARSSSLWWSGKVRVVPAAISASQSVPGESAPPGAAFAKPGSGRNLSSLHCFSAHFWLRAKAVGGDAGSAPSIDFGAAVGLAALGALGALELDDSNPEFSGIGATGKTSVGGG